MKKLVLKLVERKDDDDCVTAQKLYAGGKMVFCCFDLSQCPEDAIIGRDLFDVFDYIKAVEYGISLAQKGVTEVEIASDEDEEE